MEMVGQISSPYNIYNNTSCPLVVTWALADGNPCAQCNNSGGGITIPAGSYLSIVDGDFNVCNSTATACDVRVTLLQAIGSGTFTPVSVSGSMQNNSSATVTHCVGGTYSYQLTWSVTETKIN
ncbi:MAG: hypothetical protein KF900_03785 [Bacteroidetes bacterium]|nr:hypothetical protein [Bacteroidota bacterium]